MLRNCKPIFGSVKDVVFESGFFVANVIFELETRCVYGVGLIKKRRYWSRNVPGNDIDKHFEGKEVVLVDFLEMKIYGGNVFKIHHIKKSYYVMKLIT